MAIKRKSLIVAAALAWSVAGFASIALAAEPYGNWVRPSSGTQVNFYARAAKKQSALSL